MTPSEDVVRIPCSARRNSKKVYAKLLTRVDRAAQNGFGFEGTLLRPGKIVPRAALWPTTGHPRIPVLLECAGNDDPERGHRRHHQTDLYVLWRFDSVRTEWKELARSASESWTWALDLRELAARALEESNSPAIEVFVSYDVLAQRLDAMLTRELQRLSVLDRRRAIAILHDQFCSHIARLAE
jgi:hypothetical protein